MLEYLKYRCCMCPNITCPDCKTCPGIRGSLHPDASQCRFVKMYIDSRGWRYEVQNSTVSGQVQTKKFKGFYLVPGNHTWLPMLRLPMMSTFDGAQSMLNAYAEKKGWKETNDIL